MGQHLYVRKPIVNKSGLFLETFLRREKVLTKFIENVRKQRKDCKDLTSMEALMKAAPIYVQSTLTGPQAITSLLNWTSTSDGFSYWKEMHEKFVSAYRQHEEEVYLAKQVAANVNAGTENLAGDKVDIPLAANPTHDEHSGAVMTGDEDDEEEDEDYHHEDDDSF